MFCCFYNVLNRLIAGGCAGFIAQSTIYPMAITRTRLALANNGQYNGVLDVMKSVIRNDGFKGLYNGWSASVLGIMPYAGVELSLYNIMKDKISEYREKEQLNHVNKLNSKKCIGNINNWINLILHKVILCLTLINSLYNSKIFEVSTQEVFYA